MPAPLHWGHARGRRWYARPRRPSREWSLAAALCVPRIAPPDLGGKPPTRDTPDDQGDSLPLHGWPDTHAKTRRERKTRGRARATPDQIVDAAAEDLSQRLKIGRAHV